MAGAPKRTPNGGPSPKIDLERDPRVRAALQLLVGATNPLPVEEAAQIVNLSVSRLRHLIRQELGVPLHLYVKRLRLCRARELVAGTFLSMKEIMSAAGFTDISHFLRDYKTAFGETPSQTRRRDSYRGQ